ncbi:MAG: F0F1 ATP synthase subunit epsilon [Hyphomicrobiales bacterium]|nr:F0F1 ATP synthase subunit epsilon [Hyphomicrobiales bacterium]
MAAFHFELVSPEQLLFSGEVDSVVVPGAEGQMTILKDHAPVMTTLKPGVVEVAETASKKSRIFVRGGFADVAASGLTILAEVAVPVEQLDAAKIAQEIKNAQEDASDASTDEAKRVAGEKLDQLNELKVALGL